MTDLISEKDRIEIEKHIVQQCAPVILGIKISNLLVLNDDERTYAKEIFQGSDLSLHVLCQHTMKTYCLVYQPKKLEHYINQDPNYKYLSQLGYDPTEKDLVIQKIAYKYNAYMRNHKQFPHEIGLLLGYPFVDVSNFIRTSGTGYLYSGYWKVYANVSETRMEFRRYHRSKELLYQLIIHGGKLVTVIQDVIKYDTN